MFDAVTGMRSAMIATAAAALLSLMPVATMADQSPFDKRAETDEQEMLAKARREADDHRRASVRRLEGTVGKNTTVNIGEPPAGEKAAQARSREDELQRLSDKLRRASQTRVARPTAPAVDTPWTTEVTVLPDTEAEKPTYKSESRSALGQRAAANRGVETDESHVAILMVMKPGDRGIRRFDKSADPILCTNDGCYVSNGGGVPAQFISLRRSFGFANTFGPRAGACRHQTGCVFRGVDVGAHNAFVQPVDLKMVIHDRRAMKAVQPDDSCKVDAGRLSCGRAIRGEDFVIWAVPERVARQAGAAALLRAVEEGLPEAARRAAIDRRLD
jgi:hypothetical protein